MRVYLGACVCMLVSACDMTHSCVMLHLRERFLWQSVYVCVCVCACVCACECVCVLVCVCMCGIPRVCVTRKDVRIHTSLFAKEPPLMGFICGK